MPARSNERTLIKSEYLLTLLSRPVSLLLTKEKSSFITVVPSLWEGKSDLNCNFCCDAIIWGDRKPCGPGFKIPIISNIDGNKTELSESFVRTFGIND